MNEQIRKHVMEYCQSKGWEATEEGIIEAIREAKKVWSGDESAHRWWTTEFKVVEVNGMLIGFVNAITTGDESAHDKGWEFDPSTICQVVAKSITITTYEPAA